MSVLSGVKNVKRHSWNPGRVVAATNTHCAGTQSAIISLYLSHESAIATLLVQDDEEGCERHVYYLSRVMNVVCNLLQ